MLNLFDHRMNQISKFSRRKLLGRLALTGASAGILTIAKAQKNTSTKDIRLNKGMTILFQGDSITDAGRQNRQAPKANDQKSMGNGYASMAASALLTSLPDHNLSIYNRGISGNKVHQLDARWQTDCIDHQPDILSILIGVNDIWHGLNGRYDGTVQRYEEDYMALLERTRKALPNVQLVVCEPFVLKCGAVNEKWFPNSIITVHPPVKWQTKTTLLLYPFRKCLTRLSSMHHPSTGRVTGYIHPCMVLR